MAKKFFLILNGVNYFLSHRLPIAIELKQLGYDVHIVTPDDMPPDFERYGFSYHKLRMSRKGINPFADFKVIFDFYLLFMRLKPDLVHLVTIKPYLYGGIAARLAGVNCVVSAVAGLGILFSRNSLKNRVLRCILFPLFKFAFEHKNQTIIFQNEDDCKTLVQWVGLSKQKTIVIRGAGVDLENYPFISEPFNSVPVISFAARLLKDKGVLEFVEASRILKQRNIHSRFILIGSPDSGNANSVTEQDITSWQDQGLVEYFGYRKDIANLFAQSNVITLPSFYGEGLPKVLIEAAACGRAVVTTDWPGCRDAIIPDETGLLVPIKDSVALADAIQSLIIDANKRLAMGKAGRKLAEEVFDVNAVVDAHIEIYNKLQSNSH